MGKPVGIPTDEDAEGAIKGDDVEARRGIRERDAVKVMG